MQKYHISLIIEFCTRSKNTLWVQNGSTNMGSLAGYWIILRLFSLTFQVFFHIEKQNN